MLVLVEANLTAFGGSRVITSLNPENVNPVSLPVSFKLLKVVQASALSSKPYILQGGYLGFKSLGFRVPVEFSHMGLKKGLAHAIYVLVRYEVFSLVALSPLPY